MPLHNHIFPALIVIVALMIVVAAHAQGSSDQKAQEQQQAIEGQNPLLPKRMQVSFSGSGSATFTPRNDNGSLSGPTPEPNCTPAVTQVGFNLQCLKDPDTKSASTCRGSLSFYGFNETRNVSGEVSSTAPDTYVMKLHSSDGDIDGCQIGNVAPVSSTLGNVIVMPGCGLKVAGCAGEAVGSGANRALTASGAVMLTPSD